MAVFRGFRGIFKLKTNLNLSCPWDVVKKRRGCLTFATKRQTIEEIKILYGKKKKQIYGKKLMCSNGANNVLTISFNL